MEEEFLAQSAGNFLPRIYSRLFPSSVFPAKAGIQVCVFAASSWMPAGVYPEFIEGPA
jgi:hypothetical protein